MAAFSLPPNKILTLLPCTNKIHYMKIQFIETTPFSRDREQYLPEPEFQLFETHLLQYPEAGDLIVGTGGCRKIRWKRQGMGNRAESGLFTTI